MTARDSQSADGFPGKIRMDSLAPEQALACMYFLVCGSEEQKRAVIRATSAGAREAQNERTPFLDYLERP